MLTPVVMPMISVTKWIEPVGILTLYNMLNMIIEAEERSVHKFPISENILHTFEIVISVSNVIALHNEMVYKLHKYIA